MLEEAKELSDAGGMCNILLSTQKRQYGPQFRSRTVMIKTWATWTNDWEHQRPAVSSHFCFGREGKGSSMSLFWNCPVIFFSQPKRSYVSVTSTGLKLFSFVTFSKFRRLRFNKFAVLSGIPSMPKNLSVIATRELRSKHRSRDKMRFSCSCSRWLPLCPFDVRRTVLILFLIKDHTYSFQELRLGLVWNAEDNLTWDNILGNKYWRGRSFLTVRLLKRKLLMSMG